MQEIIIKKNEAGQRFDKYLGKYFKEATPSFIYKMLRKKNIELNSKKATGSEKLVEGDVVKIFMADDTIAKFRGKTSCDLSIAKSEGNSHLIINSQYAKVIRDNIIYEDDNILIVNKPVGILSQKATPTDISINEMFIDYLLEEKKITYEELETFKPSVCNRLDRNTSGLITFGKTLLGVQELSNGFKYRTFDKYYLAVVWGEVKNSSHIDGYLYKDIKTNKVTISNKESKDASYIQTAYEPLKTAFVNINNKNMPITLLKIKLITGKTHQIRAHLASINHGLLGDDKYGNPRLNMELKKHFKINYQMLHSYILDFKDTKGLEGLCSLHNKEIKAPITADINKLFNIDYEE